MKLNEKIISYRNDDFNFNFYFLLKSVSVACHECLGKTFSNAGHWRRHMRLKHFFNSSIMKTPEGNQNQVIETIDIEDESISQMRN
jgi:hypothetical protein